MEKITTVASAFVFIEILQWILINHLFRVIKSLRRTYVKLALSHNVAVMDISIYIKEDPMQKAKTRELTDEEKSIFEKCHALISKMEIEFKNIGIKPGVVR